jgi:hypothetical protein
VSNLISSDAVKKCSIIFFASLLTRIPLVVLHMCNKRKVSYFEPPTDPFDEETLKRKRRHAINKKLKETGVLTHHAAFGARGRRTYSTSRENIFFRHTIRLDQPRQENILFIYRSNQTSQERKPSQRYSVSPYLSQVQNLVCAEPL